MKTFKILSFVAGILALTALASCAEKVEDPSITIEGENTVTLTKEKASFSVKVLSNRDWGMRFVGNTPDWIVAEPSTGKASKTPSEIKITVTENTGANRTASVEFYTGVATAMLTIVQAGPDGDSDGLEALTVQQFINKADKTTYYRLTGTVSAFKTGTNNSGKDWMQFNLTDGTGTILVYGFEGGQYEEWSGKIKNNGTIVLRGRYDYYQKEGSSTGQHEVVSATIESFNGGGDVTPGTPEGDGSLASPFNVAAACQAVKNLSWTDNKTYDKVGPYYVKGKVSSIDQDYTYNVSDGRTYGNARFSISDDGTTAGEQFTLYNLYYLGGERFVAGQTDIKVGDDVIIYAELMNYQGNTPENSGGYLFSLNGYDGHVDIDPVTGTVVETSAAPDGAPVTIPEATVMAKSKTGLVVADASGAVYIFYSSKNGETVPDVAVGDNVKVEATKATYGGVPEFTKPTVTKLSEGTASYPEPKDLNPVAAGYAASATEFIKATGTLKMDGDYVNLEINGVDAAARQGSISQPLDSFGVSSYDGQQVIVTGYFSGIAQSKGITYINIVLTDISPADPDAKYCNVNPAALNAKADATSASFSISSNADWTITCDNDAFTVSPASGSGNATINVTFSANEGEEARVANIKVSCPDAGVESTVVLTQAKPGGGENPFTNNVTWTLGENAYDNTSSGNSQQSAVINGETVGDLLKLGTSSKNGKATINIPAGTTKLAFYCLGWSGKTSKVTMTCGSASNVFNVKANAGVAQNPPYTVTTTAEESYYEFTVPSTSATKIEVASEGRVILWGINAY